MTDRAPTTGLWGAPGQIRAEYVDDVAHASQTPSSHLSLSVRNSEPSDTPTCQTRTQSVSALPDVWRSQLSLSSALSSITQDAASLCPGTSSVPRHSAPHVLLSHDTSPRSFSSAHSSPLHGTQRRASYAHDPLGQRRGSDTFSAAGAAAASSLWSPIDDPKLAYRRSTLHIGDVITPVPPGPMPRRVSSRRMSWDDAEPPIDVEPPVPMPPPQPSAQRPGYTKIPFRYTARCP